MARTWTAAEIFDDWHEETTDELDDDRTLPAEVFANFRDQLLAKIQQRLDLGEDYNDARDATRTVAKDFGKILKILTRKEQEVPIGLFMAVFKLIKFHPACLSGGMGGGVWCDI